jgi:hypothetical protein
MATGIQNTGLNLAVDRAAAPLAANNDTNIYPLIAIRLAATQLGVTVIPKQISIICTPRRIERVWARAVAS